MLTIFCQRLNQNELDTIENAYKVLRDAQFEMNELINSMYDVIPDSDVIYEIINLSDALDAVERLSEILVMYAKLFNETKKSSENV